MCRTYGGFRYSTCSLDRTQQHIFADENTEFEIEPDLLSLRKKVMSIPLVYGFGAISRRAVRLSLPLTLVTILVVYGFQGNTATARRYEHFLCWRDGKLFLDV